MQKMYTSTHTHTMHVRKKKLTHNVDKVSSITMQKMHTPHTHTAHTHRHTPTHTHPHLSLIHI